MMEYHIMLYIYYIHTLHYLVNKLQTDLEKVWYLHTTDNNFFQTAKVDVFFFCCEEVILSYVYVYCD